MPSTLTQTGPWLVEPTGLDRQDALVAQQSPAGPPVLRPRWSAAELAGLLERPAPTGEQAGVIEAPLSSMLVVAGAGCGKTDTMASRVVWLVANGLVAAGEVLGLTFTRKAAAELSERVAGRLARLHRVLPDAVGSADCGEADVGTYHSFAGRLLTEHGLRLGVEPHTRLLGEASAWQYAHEVVRDYDGPVDHLQLASSTLTRAVLDLAGELADHLQDVPTLRAELDRLTALIEGLPSGRSRGGAPAGVRAFTTTLAARRQLLPLVVRYQELKRRRDSLDFADQVALACRLVQEHPDVARAVRASYRAVLLDEVQDTSAAQMLLLYTLFAAPQAGDPVAVTAVGDPHQSIYGWRGASATTMSAFVDGFAADQGPTAQRCLATSWRNDGRILAVANHIVDPLRVETPLVVPPVVPRPDAAHGGVELARLANLAQEADYLAHWIEQRWRPTSGAGSGRSAAVLCRRRSQFPAVIAALTRRGLPVEVVGLGGLLSAPDVSDLADLLAVVDDPGASSALVRLLTGPAMNLGVADLNALAAWSHQVSHESLQQRPSRAGQSASAEDEHAVGLIEAMSSVPPGWVGPQGESVGAAAAERLAWLSAVVARLRGRRGVSLPELVADAERAFGLDIEVAARPSEAAEAARAHLDAFGEVAATFAANADRASLGGFLAWLEAARAEERGLSSPGAPTNPNAVQVLTIHAAKGLEWDVVAVPGLVEGVFPAHPGGRSSWRDGQWRVSRARDKGWIGRVAALPYHLRGDRDALPQVPWHSCPDLVSLEQALADVAEQGGDRLVAEERKLCYVAMTRARHELLLSAPVWASGTTPRVTSRFMSELRDGAESAGSHLDLGPWHDLPKPDDIARLRPSAPVAHWPRVEPPQRAVQRAADRVVQATHHNPALDTGDVLASSPSGRSNSGWRAIDHHITLLLAETASSAGQRHGVSGVEALTEGVVLEAAAPTQGEALAELPAELWASQVRRWQDDPEGLALDRRRPIPQPPSPERDRGIALHARIEAHYRQPYLFELTGERAADGDRGPDPQLEALWANFLASTWAGQRPMALELPVECEVAGVTIRGRIDAVFPQQPGRGSAPGRYVLVDWKAGRPTHTERAHEYALQLSVYRVVFAQLMGISVDHVRAALFYADTGETQWPQLLSPRELFAVISRSDAAPDGQEAPGSDERGVLGRDAARRDAE